MKKISFIIGILSIFVFAGNALAGTYDPASGIAVPTSGENFEIFNNAGTLANNYPCYITDQPMSTKKPFETVPGTNAWAACNGFKGSFVYLFSTNGSLSETYQAQFDNNWVSTETPYSGSVVTQDAIDYRATLDALDDSTSGLQSSLMDGSLKVIGIALGVWALFFLVGKLRKHTK